MLQSKLNPATCPLTLEQAWRTVGANLGFQLSRPNTWWPSPNKPDTAYHCSQVSEQDKSGIQTIRTSPCSPDAGAVGAVPPQPSACRLLSLSLPQLGCCCCGCCTWGPPQAACDCCRPGGACAPAGGGAVKPDCLACGAWLAGCRMTCFLGGHLVWEAPQPPSALQFSRSLSVILMRWLHIKARSGDDSHLPGHPLQLGF